MVEEYFEPTLYDYRIDADLVLEEVRGNAKRHIGHDLVTAT
jgi:hypothetical protein